MSVPFHSLFAAAFPLGTGYRDALRNRAGLAREPSPGGRADFCERHLQAVWLDASLRPGAFDAENGESVILLHPGRWNLGPGPDFLDAHLHLEPSGRDLRGDVEIDLRAAGWHQHGHDVNPDFRNVVAHVTYEAASAQPLPGLSPDAVHIALEPQLSGMQAFSFDQIDLSAYPYAVPSADAFPANIIQRWPIDWKLNLIQAAGEARLMSKAERLDRESDRRDPHEILYRHFCGVLGYRNNRAPFLSLADSLSWDDLRQAGSTQLEYAAVLLGQAGLLPEPSPRMDEASRQWTRSCWDHWWKIQGSLPHAPLPASAWTLRSLRPLNHPRRRLIVLAALCSRHPDAFTALAQTLQSGPGAAQRFCENVLGSLTCDLWDFRLSLSTPPGDTRHALIGFDRINQYLNNIVIPLALGRETDAQDVKRWGAALLPEPHNQITRESMHVFFGPDAPRRLGKTTLQKLGLQQLFEDWVLRRSKGDDGEIKARLNALERWLQSIEKKGTDESVPF